MTAHVVIESLESTLPATLSKTVLDHLRNELGFQGVIISDDLEMKAVAERYTAKEMAKLGLSAGVDHFLVCEKPDVIFEFYRALVRCIEEKTISHQTVMDAAKRSRTWRERYYKPPGDEKDVLKWVGCGEHGAFDTKSMPEPRCCEAKRFRAQSARKAQGSRRVRSAPCFKQVLGPTRVQNGIEANMVQFGRRERRKPILPGFVQIGTKQGQRNRQKRLAHNLQQLRQRHRVRTRKIENSSNTWLERCFHHPQEIVLCGELDNGSNPISVGMRRKRRYFEGAFRTFGPTICAGRRITVSIS